MSDEYLLAQMRKNLGAPTEMHIPSQEVVLVEFPISSTALHNIANGDCCTLNDEECPFSVRFMLKDSFKSAKSDFVINKFVVQIVVSENRQFMRKEDMATRVKVVARERKVKQKAVKEEIVVEDANEALF